MFVLNLYLLISIQATIISNVKAEQVRGEPVLTPLLIKKPSVIYKRSIKDDAQQQKTLYNDIKTCNSYAVQQTAFRFDFRDTKFPNYGTFVSSKGTNKTPLQYFNYLMKHQPQYCEDRYAPNDKVKKRQLQLKRLNKMQTILNHKTVAEAVYKAQCDQETLLFHATTNMSDYTFSQLIFMTNAEQILKNCDSKITEKIVVALGNYCNHIIDIHLFNDPKDMELHRYDENKLGCDKLTQCSSWIASIATAKQATSPDHDATRQQQLSSLALVAVNHFYPLSIWQTLQVDYFRKNSYDDMIEMFVNQPFDQLKTIIKQFSDGNTYMLLRKIMGLNLCASERSPDPVIADASQQQNLCKLFTFFIEKLSISPFLQQNDRRAQQMVDDYLQKCKK